MWQLARQLKAAKDSSVGKLVWVNADVQEPCGVLGCEVPSIGVHYYNDSPFGEVDCVTHLDAVEMLPIFAATVERCSYREWTEQTDDQVRAAGLAEQGHA